MSSSTNVGRELLFAKSTLNMKCAKENEKLKIICDALCNLVAVTFWRLYYRLNA